MRPTVRLFGLTDTPSKPGEFVPTRHLGEDRLSTRRAITAYAFHTNKGNWRYADSCASTIAFQKNKTFPFWHAERTAKLFALYLNRDYIRRGDHPASYVRHPLVSGSYQLIGGYSGENLKWTWISLMLFIWFRFANEHSYLMPGWLLGTWENG